MIIPFQKDLIFKNTNKLEFEGSLYRTLSSQTSGREIVYQNMLIQFGKENFESKVNISSSIKAQNIGLNFCKLPRK